jgi:nicotinamidase/pyrazinamidase
MPIQIDPRTDALIVVDIQCDFCPGGALAVPDGDAVVPAINRLLALTDWLAIATRDWHPGDHCSFVTQGGIWPVHCVAETPGAAFHPALETARIQAVVSKATTREAEAYSGFQGTDLAAQLDARAVRRLFIVGLATDYCVKATALDARRAGFAVVVLEDAMRLVFGTILVVAGLLGVTILTRLREGQRGGGGHLQPEGVRIADTDAHPAALPGEVGRQAPAIQPGHRRGRPRPDAEYADAHPSPRQAVRLSGRG